MPRKQWSELRSAAVAAVHNPSAHVSYPKSEFTQEMSSSTTVLGELADSKRNSRNENTKEKKRYSQPQQQEHKSQEEEKDNQICSEDASSTHKRSRVETSSDYTQDNTITRSSVEFTLVESVQLRTPSKIKRQTTDTRPAGSGSSPSIDVSTANNSPNKVDNNVSRTEAELLQHHGPLTQLNNLYLPHGENSHDDSSSITTVEDQTERKDVEEKEDRLQRRREELLQISPGNLALYTRLAECGIDAIDRPFVTCAVKRAQMVVAEWASSFI